MTLETMNILLRETFFGRILNYVSNDRFISSIPKGLNPTKEETENPSSFAIVVDFVDPNDPDMPRNWPALVKFVAMISVLLLNFSFYVASALYTPSISRIREEFGATAAEGTLGLSLFVIAYGIGPLIVRIP